MSSYVYNLVDDGRGTFSQWVSQGMSLDTVTKAFYADFADDVDFVVYFYLATTSSDNEQGRFRDIYSAGGLGVAAVNRRSIYGSTESKCLTGVITLPLDMSATAPTPLIHAAYLRNWGIGLQGIDALTSFGCWGNLSANGVRGGFDVTTVKDAAGNAVADPSTIPVGAKFSVTSFDPLINRGKAFSAIELWLMGLVAKEEVPPLYSIGTKYATLTAVQSSTNTRIYTSRGIRKITTDDILRLNSAAPAPVKQTAFRTAFVLVTPTPATADQMAKAEHYAKVVGGLESHVPATGQPRLLSFSEATGGRATMDVTLTPRPPAVLRLDIHSSNKFVVAKMEPGAFEGWRTGGYNQSGATVLPVTLQLYRKFKDDFDCIVFVLDIDAVPANNPYGQYVSVSNDVVGIGKEKFSDSSYYASSGRLKCHFTLWQRTFLESGPFLHEFMHQFGNSVLETQLVSDDGQHNSGKSGDGGYGGHWGFSGCGGQLGGFDQSTLVENVDGIEGKYQASMPGMINSKGQPYFSGIANGGNRPKYSNFELYLMGLLPEDELTPFDVFTDLSIDASDGMWRNNTWNGKFRATKRVTYTRDKIVADFGTRNPSCLQAQKNFNMLVVVLTPNDTITQSTADILEGQITRMGLRGDDAQITNNFWEATGGRGSMTFDVSASIK